MQLNNSLISKLCFIICLGFVLPQTYSISGKIMECETETPIDNVDIYIENFEIGTVTDKDGYFILYLNNQELSSIDLNISMIGYQKMIMPVDLSSSIIDLGDIHIKVESLELESVHIHSHQHTSHHISDISLVGQELTDNLTGNIANTLSNQPNIGVNSFGTVTAKPILRGYSGDRFLLTKNGKKLGDLSQSAIDHVITLDITEINEIEIIRGPRSLVYGSNSIGGIINTNTIGNPRTKFDKFYKRFFFGGESFNKGLYGNMMLYIPIKNNQVNVLFSNKSTNNQSSPIGELQNTYSETLNFNLGFTKYNKNNYINFIIENFNMDYGIPPSLEGHIDGVDIELIKNNFQVNYHQDISFYDFNQFDIRYNFVDYEHQEFESDVDYFSVALSKKTHNFKIEFQSSHSIIGSELNYEQFLPMGFYWTPKTNQLDFSLYAFHQKEFNHFDLLSSFRVGGLSIKPDSNHDFYSNLNSEEVRNRYFNYFSSSVGLRKIINKFEINSWIMNTMRSPKIEELYSDGPHLGTYSYEIGEPNLELEKIYGIESSIGYNTELLNISLTTFYNYSPYYYQMTQMGVCDEEFIIGESHPCAGADYIEWGSGSSGWLYKYQTKGVESLIKGVEFNLGYNYQNFKIVYDFSLVRGDNLTNGLPLSYINPDKQIMILEYDKESMHYKLRLSKTHAQNRLGEFESYTPSSFLVDFIVGYSKKNQNITIQFNNILDQEHYNHLSRIKSIMPEAGRNVVISYKIFF